MIDTEAFFKSLEHYIQLGSASLNIIIIIDYVFELKGFD